MLLQHPFKLQCLFIFFIENVLHCLESGVMQPFRFIVCCRILVFCCFLWWASFSLPLASNYLRWDRSSYCFLCHRLGLAAVVWLGTCPGQVWLIDQSELLAENLIFLHFVIFLQEKCYISSVYTLHSVLSPSWRNRSHLECPHFPFFKQACILHLASSMFDLFLLLFLQHVWAFSCPQGDCLEDLRKSYQETNPNHSIWVLWSYIKLCVFEINILSYGILFPKC